MGTDYVTCKFCGESIRINTSADPSCCGAKQFNNGSWSCWDCLEELKEVLELV